MQYITNEEAGKGICPTCHKNNSLLGIGSTPILEQEPDSPSCSWRIVGREYLHTCRNDACKAEFRCRVYHERKFKP